jgi:F-type H+-transporting ATPase subunit delta
VSSISVRTGKARLPKAGNQALLARRYAGALYRLAQEHKLTTQLRPQVVALGTLLAQVPELLKMIADPRYNAQAIQQAMATLTQAAKLEPILVALLALLARQRRAVLLPAIISAFDQICAKYEGEVLAEISTAAPLSAEQRQALLQQLNKVIGQTVKLSCTQHPDLMGGMILQIGSLRIDASLQGRLASLTRQLHEAA